MNKKKTVIAEKSKKTLFYVNTTIVYDPIWNMSCRNN